jgi:hypothetical protein
MADPQDQGGNNKKHRRIPMMSHDLQSVALTLVATGKGILAADETIPTLTRRFDALGIQSTEHSRRTYREMLFTSRGASEFMSGVIMHDETIRQKSSDGTPLAQVNAINRAGGLKGQFLLRASASGPGAGGMAWQGREPGCRPARFCQRARANGAATVGQYTDEMEAASPGADDPPHAATGGTTDTPAHSYPIGAMRS